MLGNKESISKISLIIRSNGGTIDAPLPIINLIREYTKSIRIYVPENAHSAATLLALGGDEIVMSPISSLTPIDPQLNLNPTEDSKKNVRFSVEDVAGYYSLIDKLKITDENRIKALEFMVQNIPPTILGQIERVRELIQIYANRIIQSKKVDKTQKKLIIKKLVEEIPSHGYRISRKEAKELGLPIKDETKKQNQLLKNLMKLYKKELCEDDIELLVDFPDEQATTEKTYKRAILETVNDTYAFESKYTFHRNGKVDTSLNQWRKIR